MAAVRFRTGLGEDAYIPVFLYQTEFRALVIKNAACIDAYFSSEGTTMFEWDGPPASYEGLATNFNTTLQLLQFVP